MVSTFLEISITNYQVFKITYQNFWIPQVSLMVRSHFWSQKGYSQTYVVEMAAAWMHACRRNNVPKDFRKCQWLVHVHWSSWRTCHYAKCSWDAALAFWILEGCSSCARWCRRLVAEKANLHSKSKMIQISLLFTKQVGNTDLRTCCADGLL